MDEPPTKPRVPSTPFHMHPPGRPGVRFGLAGVSIDPADTDQRRAYLNAFYGHMWQLTDETISSRLESAVMKLCQRYLSSEKGIPGTKYFEYLCDVVLWGDLFTDCNDNKMQVPDFPWPDFKPVFDDPSDSDSLVFIRWLETEKAKQGTTPTETQIDIKGSSRTPRHFVPDLEMRQRAWNDIQGNAELIPPVCGPFELQLPPWFDFKAQVWGPQGIELKRINNELIDEKLKVTWGVGDREPGAPAVVDRLIVGFSKATDAKAAFRPSTLVSLSTLWRAVCIWGASMYEGRSRTLVRHLEVAMKVHIGIDLDHLPNGGGPVISAYTAAEEDVNAVKKKTDEHKEALVALRDEVLKLAEDGCTTAKLGFWALQGNVDDAETALARIDVAEQVWETACSGARDVMKVLEKTEEARRAVLLMTSTT